MNVAELIAVLKKLPKDARVVVRGYEDGVDDVGAASLVDIELDHYNEWYYGRHREVEERDRKFVKGEVVKAVHLHVTQESRK